MVVNNLSDIIDAIQNGTPANRRALAQQLRGIENQLSNFESAAAKTASDARRVTALAFIASDVTPLLTDPTTGNYLAQHAQLVNNITIIDGFIDTAINVETVQELKNTKAGERAKLRTLKEQHAQGLIT